MAAFRQGKKYRLNSPYNVIGTTKWGVTRDAFQDAVCRAARVHTGDSEYAIIRFEDPGLEQVYEATGGADYWLRRDNFTEVRGGVHG
jgi:hypothetical protein